MTAADQKKLAVVLFNLGGPLQNEDVQPFLYNLFSDRHIIPLPFGARHAVARLISTTREKSARANYRHMGGGSPILAQTQAQAQALEAALSLNSGNRVKVFIAMRYWHPLTQEAVAEVEAFAPDDIVLLPLYPQFSKTTTFSSLERFKALYKGQARVKTVCCYPAQPDFIAAHIDLIGQALKDIDDLKTYRLLFSAHGLPEKVIQSGDPYQSQVEATVSAVMAGLKHQIDHVICYQSRVGPMQWIGPSTDATIKATAQTGKNIILVPIAFVSEHIETLVELDIEYAHLAHAHGVKDYRRVPALGTHADFIAALADEVDRTLTQDSAINSDYACEACYSFCGKRKG